MNHRTNCDTVMCRGSWDFTQASIIPPKLPPKAPNVSRFDNMSFIERMKFALPFHLEFLAIHRALSRSCDKPDAISIYTSEIVSKSLSGISEACVNAIISDTTVDISGIKIGYINSVWNLTLPGTLMDQVATTDSQVDLVSQLTSLSGFSGAMVCLSTNPEHFVFLSKYLNRLPGINSVIANRDWSLEHQKWSTEKINLPRTEEPVTISSTDYETPMNVGNIWIVRGGPSEPVSTNSGTTTSEKEKFSPTKVLYNQLEMEMLPDMLLEQLDDFVEVYIRISISEHGGILPISGITLMRSILLRPLLDMITHNRSMLDEFRLVMFNKDDRILKYFDIWTKVRTTLNDEIELNRNDESECNPAIVDIQMLEVTLLTMLNCDTIHSLTHLQDFFYQTLSFHRSIDYVSFFFGRWDQCLGSERSGIIDVKLADILPDIDGYTGHHQIWTSTPTVFQTITAIYNYCHHRAIGTISSRFAPGSIASWIEAQFGNPEWTIISQSGRKYSMHGWILLTRWPFFWDLAISGVEESKLRVATFKQISDEIMILIVRFMYRTPNTGLSTLYNAAEMDQIASFFAAENYKMYKLDRMNHILFPKKVSMEKNDVPQEQLNSIHVDAAIVGGDKVVGD